MGGLNLLNRIPLDVGFEWVDYSADIMLKKRRPDGIIEGWHGDGNYARTAVILALWKTKGTLIRPWRADVALGAQQDANGSLHVAVRSDWPWKGRLMCNVPRHRENLRLPADYPRLNQFPEWFIVDADKAYTVRLAGNDGTEFTGKQLQQGIDLELKPNDWVDMTIRPVKP